MGSVRRRCGFLNDIDVSANGLRGGLCLAWRGNAMVDLKSYSNYHIDIALTEGDSEKEWRLLAFMDPLMHTIEWLLGIF